MTGQVFVTQDASSSSSPSSPTSSSSIPRGGGASHHHRHHRSSRALSEQAGFVFVKQEDLFYSHLTVRESLMFTARLRLPKEMSCKEKEAYVEEMIARMGLTDVSMYVMFIDWIG